MSQSFLGLLYQAKHSKKIPSTVLPLLWSFFVFQISSCWNFVWLRAGKFPHKQWKSVPEMHRASSRVVWWSTQTEYDEKNYRGQSRSHFLTKKKKANYPLIHLKKYLSSLFHILTDFNWQHCVWSWEWKQNQSWPCAVCYRERHRMRTNQGLQVFGGA